MKLFLVGILCLSLLTISFFSVSNYTAYGENEIIVNSNGFEKSSILEIENSKGNNVEINSVRIWLSEDNSFESFKTEKGWIGKNTPQGVIIFTTEDSIKPGETVKFGIKTSVGEPVINWKAIDNNGNTIKSAKITTNTQNEGIIKIDQPHAVGINDESSFRLIPEKLSPGSDFRVVGNSFTPNQTLNFYINDKIEKSFSTDSNGNFIITESIPEKIDSERTKFLIMDSVGAEQEISIRLSQSEKRTIVNTLELVFSETPSSVKRGDVITLKGVATPDVTLTITSMQKTIGIISIDTITTGYDGKWSFENLFSPELELETVTIKVTDGKTKVERNVDVVSSKLISITAIESRYEPGDTISFTGNAIANTDLLFYLEDPKGHEIFSNVVTVDTSGIINFDIPTELGQMKGTYVLHANQGNEEGISVVGIGEEPADVIVVSTAKLNHNTNENIAITIQGKTDATIAIIILDDASKEKISDTINLGPDGYHIYDIEPDELSVGSYVVEVRHGKARGDTVFSIGLTQGSGPITMQTTKDDYKPGDSILLMGQTGSNSLLIISLYDSENNIVKQLDVFSNKVGGFQSDKFRIPNDPKIGEWSLKVRSGGNTAEHSFTVSNILEEIVVFVDKESKIYSLLEIVTISGAGVNPSTSVDIEFFDIEDNVISDKLTIYAKSNGEFSVNWIIPNDIIPGDIRIEVTDPITSSSTTITVN